SRRQLTCLSRDWSSDVCSSDLKDVIRPFLSGTELNSLGPKGPGTFIISFGDRSEEEASKYKECWNIVLNEVKPTRDAIKTQIHEIGRAWCREGVARHK